MPNALDTAIQKNRQLTAKDKRAINNAAHINLLQELSSIKDFAMQHDLYKTAAAIGRAMKTLRNESKTLDR